MKHQDSTELYNLNVKKRTYFDTFDAMRFIAFFLVFLSHLPYAQNSWISYFSKSGNVGVSFFFVLSGFLITYILLLEKVNTGKISLKKFFMRRILRIWPLFYAMLIVAYLTPTFLEITKLPFSNGGYEPNWWFSVLFLENYMVILEGIGANVSPLPAMWTVCVEEHFYILWGLLLYYLPVKHIPRLIVISIIITILSRVIFAYYQFNPVDITTNLSYFALGAIPAYIYVIKPKFLEKISNLHGSIKYILVILLIAYALLTSNHNLFSLYILDATLMGALFAGLILFMLPQKNKLHISKDNMLSKWGIYTYGLYLIHTVVIAFYNRLFEYHGINSYFYVAICSFITCLLLSFASYHWFEYQFLKLKKNFI